MSLQTDVPAPVTAHGVTFAVSENLMPKLIVAGGNEAPAGSVGVGSRCC